jgi:hypothetical protein
VKFEHPTFIPVANDGAGEASCIGCVFEDRSVYKMSDCVEHACFPDDFPDDHPLREARNVIWVRPQ